MKRKTQSISRRGFVRRTVGTIATFSIVPSYVLGLNGATPPSEKLNVACIGIGGQGRSSVQGTSAENIVALCDVDSKHAAATFKEFPKAKQYKDFRRMFDDMGKGIDAVTVATPDHTHAVAVLRAIKMGKHVYSEKPLAHSIHEIRSIMEATRQHKVATQLGNQGHSSDSIRTFCEWIWDGAIGTVREVHAFCGSSYGRIEDIGKIKESHPIPETLDWDLWLGPAPYRPYNPMYLPAKWRGWSQFGTGVIGDWTCHVIDPVFWALDLDAPTHIEAETFDYDPKKHFETFPKSTIVRYDFPAKGKRPPVKVTWYDGDQRPARPEELAEGENLPTIGALVVGDKGKIVYGSHGAGGVKIIPSGKMNDYKQKLPPKSIPRSTGHHKEWLEACKGGKPAGSNFEYGGPLTELALLSIIAIRMKGQRLEWDGPTTKFTNSTEANHYIQQPYRQGWSL